MLTTHCQTISAQHSLPEAQFSTLNLSSLSISIITAIPTKLMFISQLNLDNNLLTVLSGIDQFMNLQSLSVNFNFILDRHELLGIRNKFLLKDLSFIGNEIEKSATQLWLRQQGFSGLVSLNDVSRIGYVYTNDSSHTVSEPPRFFFHSFSKPAHDSRKIDDFNMSHKHNNPSLSYQNTQTKRFVHNFHGQSIMMNETDSDVTQRLSKRKQRFESTGDTRKHKISINHLNQKSFQRKSFDSSPQFNKFRENSFYQYRHNNQQNMSNMKRKNITEFRLYPVDEQTNRDKFIERQLVYPELFYQNQPEKIYRNQFRGVKPFDPVDQRSHFEGNSVQHGLKYTKYRSDYYQLDKRDAQMRTGSEQSDNNVIEREIPVYKEAIAIAFYYRNLLQKVFRGYKQLICQSKQQLPHKRLEGDLQQGESNQANHHSTHNKTKISLNTDEELINDPNTPLDLKRFAWMKIQIFANHRRITQKYTQSLNQFK